MPLKIPVNANELNFKPDGNVSSISSDGEEQVRGTWTSEDAARDNRIRYTLDGAPQPPLDAVYQFTAENQAALDPAGVAPGLNQLRVALSDGVNTSAFDFIGFIRVNDQHDAVYVLTDEDGQPTGQEIVVYGDLSIEPVSHKLLITMPSGVQTRITGIDGGRSLEAARNELAGFEAQDLLRFRASTDNQLPDGAVRSLDAQLDFVGEWDVQNGQLVFLSKIKGDITRPAVSLALAGKVKGVAFGFAYFSDEAGTQLAFEVKGQHQWLGGGAEWELALGYTDKKFSMRAAGELKRTFQSGNQLTIAGGMQLTQADGGDFNFDLELAAEYRWEDNSLAFKAKVDNTGGELNYDLRLEGRFNFSGGSLEFAIKYTNAMNVPELTIGLVLASDRENLKSAIAFHLHITPEAAELRIEASFELRMRFVAGVGRVLEEAEATAGGTK